MVVKKIATISERLSECIEENGLSQSDILRNVEPLCEEYDIPMNKVDLWRYVNGRARPGKDKLFLLSRALDVNPRWLEGYDEPKEINRSEKLDKTLLEAIQILWNYQGFVLNIDKDPFIVKDLKTKKLYTLTNKQMSSYFELLKRHNVLTDIFLSEEEKKVEKKK